MTRILPVYAEAIEGFHRGMVRDTASRIATPGTFYTAQDALCDVPGRIRRRSGVVAIGAGGTRAADGAQYNTIYDPGIPSIGPLLVGIGTPTVAGNQPGRVRVWNTTTGAGTDIDGTGTPTNSGGFGSQLKAFLGPPTLHRGILCAASAASSEYDMLFWSGSQAKGGTQYTGGSFACVLQPNGLGYQSAGTAVNFTTLSEAGHILTVFGTDAAGTACYYIGRLTSVAATSFSMDPAPPTYITGTIMTTTRAPGLLDSTNPGGGAVTHRIGHYLLSHQGRLIIGAPTNADYNGTVWSGVRMTFPRRFYWSNTKDESPSTGYKVYGYTFLSSLGYEVGSWEELPGTDPMTGWVRVSDREVLIFTRFKTYALTGDLQSITAEVGQKTWDLSERYPAVGCSSQNTIQQTTEGIVWADERGVYMLDAGGGFHRLLGANEKWWRRRVAGAAFVSPNPGLLSPTPYTGSAHARGTYFLSLRGASDGTFDTTLCIDLGSQAITTWTIPFQGSSPDPAVANKVWGMHYWKQGSFGLTNGSMVDLSAAFADASLGDTVQAADSSSASTPHLVLVSNTIVYSPMQDAPTSALTLRVTGPVSSGVAASFYTYGGMDVRAPEAAGWGTASLTLPANPGVDAKLPLTYRSVGAGLSWKLDVPNGGDRFVVDRLEYLRQLGLHEHP